MGNLNVIAEPGQQELTMTREFDAPRELAFKAYTDPNLVSRWWGPHKYKTIVDQMEAKAGGSWRFINEGDDGNQFAFHGVYHAVNAPEQIVYTFEFEGVPGHVMLETVTFEALPGDRTKIIVSGAFQSAADRDAMISSGMEEGANESWDRFAELLKTL